MKLATWVEGFVLIALGMMIMGGVLLNLGSNSYEGKWRSCTDHTSRPEALIGAGEYPATVFLDQGTVPAIFGIALTWIGGGVLVGGAILTDRVEKRSRGSERM